MRSADEAVRVARNWPGALIKSRRPCPVCGGLRARHVHTMHFVLPIESPLPARYDVLVCSQCGSGFADSNVRAEGYAEHYRSLSKYEEPGVATGGGDTPADAERIEELATFLTRLVAPTARIADIGCANGGLLRELQMRGFRDMAGFDPSAACVKRVRNLGIHAVNAALPLGSEAQGSGDLALFDLIVLSHVLEHVFDAKAVLVSLIPLLAEGGQIYIETPDAARYDTNQFPPLYFFDPEHINHFDVESLEFLGGRLQLSVVETGRKTLRLSNRCEYPAIFAVLSTADPCGKAFDNRCESLYGPLMNYVTTSLAGISSLRARVLAMIGDATPFVLWGAGSLAQRLMGEPWFPLQSLRGIVDRDKTKHGMRFAGKTITSPEQGLRDLPSGTLVLCAAAIAVDQIEKDYRSLGLNHEFKSIVK